MKFAAHINEKSAKARKGIGMIKHLRSYLPLEALISIYTAHVRSHLDYCDFIFHIPELVGNFSTDVNLNSAMDRLESLQYQAGLAVTGMWKGTNRDKVYEELGWEPLNLRRYFRRLTVFYKIMNGLTPQYLLDPVTSPRTHLYGTSTTNDLLPMKCRTQRFKNSFFPDSIDCWNKIGPEIRKIETLSLFKKTIVRIIKPDKKSIFDIHSPNLKYLFQLRTGLSALKAHKYRHSFKNTPSDTCICGNGPESTLHFLLTCPLFNTFRERLFETINPVINQLNMELDDKYLCQILLYGNDALNPIQNRSILEATLDYIQKTKRLSSE